MNATNCDRNNLDITGKIGEPLINSESFRCAGEMQRRRTGQVEARIAAQTQSNRFAHGAASSTSIRKICNEELAHFN